MNSTKIEWTSKTWNPVTGCPGPKVSPGCERCYAERIAKTRLAGRYGYDVEDPFGIHIHHERWQEPLRLKNPSHIFVCSMGDVFHNSVSFSHLATLFGVMALCPQHTFLLLTKRPERMRDFLNSTQLSHCVACAVCDLPQSVLDTCQNGEPLSWPLPNVWLGVTVCNQPELKKHLKVLLSVPAAKRYLCFEPMLGPVTVRKAYPEDYMYCSACKWHGDSDDLIREQVGIYEEESCPVCGNDGTFALDYPHDDEELALGGIDWVICGGETGPDSRPMHPDWVRSLLKQCKASCQPTPFFFKGWGGWMPSENNSCGRIGTWHEGRFYDNMGNIENISANMCRFTGKVYGHRLLDGEEWNEVPS